MESFINLVNGEPHIQLITPVILPVPGTFRPLRLSQQKPFGRRVTKLSFYLKQAPSYHNNSLELRKKFAQCFSSL